MTPSLAGRSLLVVEDEFFLAKTLASALRAEGAKVIGPASNIEAALALLNNTQHLDGAVIDLNLQGEMAYAIADALLARKVPFVFATGYDSIAILPDYRKLPRLEKPTNPRAIAHALFS